MQIREGVLTMLDTATCGAAATAGMACGALTVASGDPAATAATRRTVASGRNLRMTCSFLVRFRSAAVEGPTTPHIIQGARRLVLRYKGERRGAVRTGDETSIRRAERGRWQVSVRIQGREANFQPSRFIRS
jgi:hypothetical protein